MSTQTQTHRTTTKKTKLRRKSAKQRHEEGEREIAKMAKGLKAKRSSYLQLGNRLNDLIEDHNMPEGAAELLFDAAQQFIERYNDGSAESFPARFATACKEAVGAAAKITAEELNAIDKTYEKIRLRSLISDVFGRDDHDTFALLNAIVELTQRPNDQRAQALVFSHCIAEVMANPLTPVALYNNIGDELASIEDEITTDYVLRSGGLVPGLLSVAAKASQETETSSSKPEEGDEAAQLECYQLSISKLVAFMKDETTPAGLRDAISNSVMDFVEEHDGSNTGLEVTQFQLANACLKAARKEGDQMASE